MHAYYYYMRAASKVRNLRAFLALAYAAQKKNSAA